MATSKSNSEQAAWQAGAMVFSGRPDPTWELADSVAAALVAVWDELVETGDPLPAGPPLGYRGCYLRHGADCEWTAFGGVVSCRRRTGHTARTDPARRFEQELLMSAPPGTLPPWAFQSLESDGPS
jgi:hypothetical protein